MLHIQRRTNGKREKKETEQPQQNWTLLHYGMWCGFFCISSSDPTNQRTHTHTRVFQVVFVSSELVLVHFFSLWSSSSASSSFARLLRTFLWLLSPCGFCTFCCNLRITHTSRACFKRTTVMSFSRRFYFLRYCLEYFWNFTPRFHSFAFDVVAFWDNTSSLKPQCKGRSTVNARFLLNRFSAAEKSFVCRCIIQNSRQRM